MDPYDPLTEIIKSGQGFSSSIVLERIIWLMIGFFFLGAISTSIKNGMKNQDWFSNKSFLTGIKNSKNKNDKAMKLPEEDN